jgi:hypothetical protein
MDFGIETLATPATMIFCLSVYAVVFCIRKIVEGVGRRWDVANGHVWRGILLPLLPCLVGVGGGAAMPFFPYPEGITHWGARALFGLVCGFTSATVYQIAISIVRKQWPGVLPQSAGDA